jgi:SnoaL-like domain
MNVDAARSQSAQEPELHAIQRAFLAKDGDAIAELLASDVVLNSPIISTKFRGRQEIADLFRGVLDVLEDLRYTDTIRADATLVAAFKARIGRQEMQGVDLFRFDREGKIDDITVVIRPLAGLTALAAALGPRLVRQSPWRTLVVRALSRPLAAMTRAADPVAARLILRRRDR